MAPAGILPDGASSTRPRHTPARCWKSWWDAPSFEASRLAGDRWHDEGRTAVLLAPSVVTRVERNVLINQDHPDFPRIRATPPAPVRWDARLWKRLT